MEREINNGGFNQYFFNSSGDFTQKTIQSLQTIGANKTADILQRAIDQFPNGNVPEDRTERQKMLKQIQETVKSVQHAKQILDNSQSTLFDTAYQTELSGTNRIHDLFVEIEIMTPEEYKNKGENLSINYSFAESLFGSVLIASTHKGICYMGFADNEQVAFSELENRFPKATFIPQMDNVQQNALQIYTQNWSKINPIKLHLKGTDFQLKVWETLLKIPRGSLVTYGTIAKFIQKPKASRAVGTAIGSNPIAFLIPCHRVIQSTGEFGGYMWGITRKTAIIGWEVSTIDNWIMTV